MKVVMATLLLVSLLLSSSFLAIANAHYSSICDSKCEVRCSKAGEKKRCLKYCGICCEECKYCAPSRTNKNEWECKYCVPSGTYGNKWECPCYQKKLNSKGYPKCP